MTCKKCRLNLGEEYRLEPTWVGCTECNADLLSLFPRYGYYMGITLLGNHHFIFTAPTICPVCGQCSVGMTMPCDDNGGYYEVTQNQQSQETFQPLPEQQLVSLLSE